MDVKKLLYGTEKEQKEELVKLQKPLEINDVCYAGSNKGVIIMDNVYLEPVIAFTVKAVVNNKQEYGEITLPCCNSEWIDKFTNLKDLIKQTKNLHDAIKVYYQKYINELIVQLKDILSNVDKINSIIEEPVVKSVMSTVITPYINVSVKISDPKDICLYHPNFHIMISFIGRNGKVGTVTLGWYNVSDTFINNFDVLLKPIFEKEEEEDLDR